MQVFENNSVIYEAYAKNRKELIRVSTVGGDTRFDTAYLLNFTHRVSSDVQWSKQTNFSFLLTVFGRNLVPMTLSGVQADSVLTSSNATVTSTDVEDYFNDYNITEDSRELLQINTSTKDNPKKVYLGYMTDFVKKPMGEDKFQGYAFDVTLVCWLKVR